jgi:hypothetical protein
VHAAKPGTATALGSADVVSLAKARQERNRIEAERRNGVAILPRVSGVAAGKPFGEAHIAPQEEGLGVDTISTSPAMF